MRRFLHSFYGLFLLSLLFAAVLLYPLFVDAARESTRSSVRSASSRPSGAGTRQLGNRPENAGRSTFSKEDLTVLCGRYFDTCAESYVPQKREYKDPKCQELMPQCFERFGPTPQQCQDTVYTCLDQICQPRGQCSDEARVKEMAVACLEKGDEYYPYVCSVRSFKSVISQILTEAGGDMFSRQQPTQTIVKNEISPELQARMDAQEAALEEQQAMLARQQAALAEAEAERERMAAEAEEEEEEEAPSSGNDAMWEELEKCEALLKESEGYVNEAMEYAKCSPFVDPISDESGDGSDFEKVKFKGKDEKNVSTDCSMPPRVKGLQYRLNTALKSLKKTKSCAYEMNRTVAKAKTNTDYVQMLRRRFRYMDEGTVGSSIVKLNMVNFITESSGTYKEKENFDKNPLPGAIEIALHDTKLLYDMNKIVVEDLSNMLSGVQLDSRGSGKEACQGLFGGAMDQCVMSTATQYYNDISRKSSPTSTDYHKVLSLYQNSAYLLEDICDENGLGSSPSDIGTLKDCLQAMRRRSQKNQQRQQRPYY
ncbi:MAG: hypothetical protein JXQ74_03150 [Alphaproteobacteria bacterium]|nr:hypothetical protein [Alphaproteobacteria bacterium]